MIVLVMGVSGAGKTTLGEALARRLGWRYLDADDFHPPANVAKMASGTPLQDADRWPWLAKINAELLKLQAAGASAVVACSALKASYRAALLEGVRESRIVFLDAPFEIIQSRAAGRQHRFMPASLLKSQFETLEPPQRALQVDVSAPLDDCLAQVVGALGPRA